MFLPNIIESVYGGKVIAKIKRVNFFETQCSTYFILTLYWAVYHHQLIELNGRMTVNLTISSLLWQSASAWSGDVPLNEKIPSLQILRYNKL